MFKVLIIDSFTSRVAGYCEFLNWFELDVLAACINQIIEHKPTLQLRE